MKTLGIEQTKEMLVFVADRIIENTALLTAVDNKIGDGDHGIGMSGGMLKAKEALLQQKNFASVNDLFILFGKTMMMSMGGASGIIFGTMFSGGAKKCLPTQELDRTVFCTMMRASLDAVKQRGKAEIGDKTMVDLSLIHICRPYALFPECGGYFSAEPCRAGTGGCFHRLCPG